MNLFRAAAVAPRVHVGNVAKNRQEIIKAYDSLAEQADLIVTPELSLTGYTCADLFNNRNLLDRARRGLYDLAMYTKKYGENGAVLVVGVPLEIEGELFNCAAVIHNGRLEAVIPKTYLPNYGEFYEKRWFSAGERDARELVLVCGMETLRTTFGNNVIVEIGTDKKVCVGIEICEDAWAPISPGRLLALNGAEIIVNLSASNEVIGKAQYRKNMLGAASAGCICGYVYVSAGQYESTSDLVFSGHALMYENGKLLGEGKPFSDTVLVKDFNLTKIRHDRIANKTYSECKNNFPARCYHRLACQKPLMEKRELLPGRFREFFRQMGIEHIDPELMQKQYEKELGTKTYFVDDSYEIVTKLKEMGLKQYIVTNGILTTQQIKMKNSGFDKLIDKVFISSVIGYEKPRREFFDIVFEEIAGFQKERALLIGDSLTADMRGANHAGVDACWYNPGGKVLPEQSGSKEPLHVEYEIGNLEEVFGIVRE